MGEVINLNRFRKARARSQEAKQADENRTRYGRTKEDKRRGKAESDRASKELDGKKLE